MSWILTSAMLKSSYKELHNKHCASVPMFLLLFHISQLSFVISSSLSVAALRNYAMSNYFISKSEGRKNNLIFQNSHLAGQLSMFLSVSTSIPISHSGLHSTVTTSLRIDHTRRSWNILTGPMSSPPMNSLRDWFHFSIQQTPPPPKLSPHSSTRCCHLLFIFPVLGETVFSLISWIKVK